MSPSDAARSQEKRVKPLFTIAIPTFNRAEWLGRSVGSALAQTHDSFEVLVSDNGSDDETPQVLAEISDPRLIKFASRATSARSRTGTPVSSMHAASSS